MIKRVTWMACLGAIALAAGLAAAQAPAAEPASAKVWVGKAAEYETYIRTAPFVRTTERASISRPRSDARGSRLERSSWTSVPSMHPPQRAEVRLRP